MAAPQESGKIVLVLSNLTINPLNKEETTMYYVGADLHKEQTWFYVMDKNGNKITSQSIANSPDLLKRFFATIPTPFLLAVEATYNWYFFMDIAEQFAQNAYLANSFELKAFAKRHKKTDKIDACLIANILRKGFLPAVFIPDRSIRQLKELLHHRINLVRDRSRNIFRLKNILDKLGANSIGDFTTTKQLQMIPVGSLPEHSRYVATGCIEQIIQLNQRINKMRTYLRNELSNDKEIKNLITINGLDYFSAALIKSEIADINRFASFNRLCAYAGLAPRVSQSGNKSAHHGALMTNRRKNLQWILIETTFHFIKASAQRQARYEELKVRKGVNTAKVVMARQMLKVIYHVLKEQRPYYYDKNIKEVEVNLIQSVAAA